MSISITMTVSDANAARVVAAMMSLYEREEGLTDKQFFIACQKQWLIEMVMNHEQHVAMGSIVPDDGLVDIEK